MLGRLDVASDLLRSIACPSCELLCSPPNEMPDGFRCPRCPRCGGVVWRRKPESIQRTWALVSAAAGSTFKLHDEPKKKWLDWRPHI